MTLLITGNPYDVLYNNPEIFKINNNFPKIYNPTSPRNATKEWVPFNWKRDSANGFICRMVANKYEVLSIDGKIVCGVQDKAFEYPFSYAPLQGCKYFVQINNGGIGKHCCLGFKGPLLPLHIASKSLKFKRGTVPMHVIRSLDWGVNRQYKILKPLIDILEDEEYNNLVGAKSTPVVGLPTRHYSTSFPEGVCDDGLYNLFAEKLRDTIYQPIKQGAKWGSKSNCVGSLETHPGEELLLRGRKRDVDFDYVYECIKTNGFPAVVTRFPKSGCLKTDGTVRSIYPMNILYECFLRVYFGDAKPITGHKIVRGRDFGAPLRNFYDIKSCDEVILPYLARFAREEDMRWLIPMVVDPIGFHAHKPYYSDQFPSGVYHTSLVTTCFTAALCDLHGATDAVIQGDGFMTNTVITGDKRIRTCTDFNGFKYVNGVWCYNRAHTLGEAKYIRGNGPRGLMRYNVLHWAYNALDALDMPPFLIPPCKLPCHNTYGIVKCPCGEELYDGCHFVELDDTQKCQFLSDRYADLGHVVKIALDERKASAGLAVADTRKNGWDTFPMSEVRGVVDGGVDLYPRYHIEV